MDQSSQTPWPWTVVLPVKGGPLAKTRLSPLGSRRLAVAAAVATDTVAAVRATSRVAEIIVVTGDAAVATAMTAMGAVVVDDPGTGLDDAVRAGLRRAPAHRPCAVMQADLPAVRPMDLTEALDLCTAALAAGAVRVVVPDARGDGTVLMAAGHPAALHPAFGPGSALRHANGGVLLTLDSARLRRDVDTPEDLAEALALGVGPATALAVQGRPAYC